MRLLTVMRPTGTVEIDVEACKGCGLCIDACSLRLLALSRQLNSQGYQVVEALCSTKCTACGLCAITCPDCAIAVYKETDGEAYESK